MTQTSGLTNSETAEIIAEAKGTFTNMKQIFEAAEGGDGIEEIARRLTPKTAQWVRGWECQARNESPGTPEHARAVADGELWRTVLLPAARTIAPPDDTGEARQPSQREALITCDCGHKVPGSAVMSTSRGSSCPDCYDEMSD